MSIRPIILGSLAALAVAAPSQTVVGATISIEAGIDSQTRDFLDSLPTNVRVQAVAAIKEIAPIFQKTADEIIDRFGKMSRERIQQLQCTAPIAANLLDEVAERIYGRFSLARLFSRKKVEISTHPSESLVNLIEQAKAGIGRGTSGTRIAAVYSDLLLSSQKVRCIAQFADATTAIAFIEQKRDQLSIEATPWNWIEASSCGSASACYKMAYEQTGLLLEKANRFDVNKPEVQNLVASIKEPTISVNGFGPTKDGYSLGLITEELRKLYMIEISVFKSSLARHERATAMLAEIDKKLIEAEATKASSVRAIAVSKVRRTLDLSSGALESLRGFSIDPDIDQALAVSDAPKPIADSLKTRQALLMGDLEKQIAQGRANQADAEK